MSGRIPETNFWKCLFRDSEASAEFLFFGNAPLCGKKMKGRKNKWRAILFFSAPGVIDIS